MPVMTSSEQIRESIELLLHELNRALYKRPELLEIVQRNSQGGALSERRTLDALYQAAVRIIMRLVIIFFAEARDMLPRTIPLYHNSYSLESLYEELNRAMQHDGRKALDEQESAWTRLLSLFTLIYEGSRAPTLPVQAYGGLLFRPGERTSPDATLRALALFESLKAMTISDAAILNLLRKLKTGRLKIHQKGASHWVSGPVDFSELRTEYIGLIYQSLLDFNLYRATQPMLLLNLGQEPVLPLELLEKMPEAQLKELLQKLKTEKGNSTLESEGEEEALKSRYFEERDTPVGTGGSSPSHGQTPNQKPLSAPAYHALLVGTNSVPKIPPLVEDEAGSEQEGVNEQEELTQTAEDKLRQRAYTWAEKAVELAGLVTLKQPKGKQQQDSYIYDNECKRQARKLIKQTLAKNEFYLLRRGDTRKGSGTFYTRPQLSVPITWRTLEPLAYTSTEHGTRIPRRPEEILALKVCDPACGSASFLIAALHYLTDALYASLVYYYDIDKVPETGESCRIITLPMGIDSQALLEEEPLPTHASDRNTERRSKSRLSPDSTITLSITDTGNFESRTKSLLRRYVVERCIYGVDLSPLAVELARMSLWIETMDSQLPFTFLDHKIKVGNSLVGAWFDTFREYPIMAWMREGGDTNHTNGVHYQAKEWTKALVKERNEVIKPQLIRHIESGGPQLLLLAEEKQTTPEPFHSEMEQIHLMPIESIQERKARYLEMQQRPDYKAMKRAFDSWCSIWFWPADTLAQAPTPTNFYTPPPDTQRMVDELADELHFFHWEIEFPDVFARAEYGFDAILANPPWETAKPYSKEFFSDYDPLYRTYGKQEALTEQKRLFQHDQTIEREWLLYQAFFKSMGNWVKRAATPFGDPLVRKDDAFSLKTGREGAQLHTIWRERRARHHSLVDQNAPFRYQGSADLNTYKLFLEIAHHLLKTHGHLGMVVPSGIYTDSGSAELRKLFLDQCNWTMLFCFINRKGIFEIDDRFKFVVLQLEKGGQTDTLHVTFNQELLADLEQPEQYLLNYPRTQVERLSPKSTAIVEIQTTHDQAILEKLYRNTVLLGDQSINSWQIKYATEFHMTNDSKLFPPLPTWQEKGYQADGYGHWIDTKGNIALPLYEGRMISAFDPSEKRWVSGKGRTALWRDIPCESKCLGPQYLMPYTTAKEQIGALSVNKISFMSIGSATNARSMYACCIANFPCGNSLSTLKLGKGSLPDLFALETLLNSLTYDYTLRSRLGGLNLNYFVLAETPLIPPAHIRPTICAQLAARLNLIMPGFAPQWLEMRKAYPELGQRHWRRLWAITEHERLRLRCILDAIVAELYGLDYEDFAWILRDDRSNPKGFWRVDKEKPREVRHTTLALAAFARLKEVGLEAFMWEDWQLPAEVAAQLGPRFTAWQQVGTVEESWAECEGHARRMRELFPVERAVVSFTGGSGGAKAGSPVLAGGEVVRKATEERGEYGDGEGA